MACVTIKYSRWLSLLAIFAMFGCTSLPEKQQGVWPWEYGNGQGEPNTGDYFSFRAGVAKFGETPALVKPVVPESVAPRTPVEFSAAAAAAARTEPEAPSNTVPDRITNKTKKDYDFTVSEKKSVSLAPLLLDSASSVYDISAFNYGNAPVSVAINLDQNKSENTAADRTLPHYAVVPANTDLNLVHFSAKRKGEAFNFSYNYKWMIGDYTASHNCPEQYRFPFGEKTTAFANVYDPAGSSPYTRYAMAFSVAKGTPVLAARKGTVIRISPDEKVDILHDDSTIGTYSHFKKIAENIVVGKTVTTEDALGIAGTAENNKDAYIQLTVWRPEPVPSDAWPVNSQRIDLVAVSLPMAFSTADSDIGRVLTQSQPVSRGKLTTANKQIKRKR